MDFCSRQLIKKHDYTRSHLVQQNTNDHEFVSIRTGQEKGPKMCLLEIQ